MTQALEDEAPALPDPAQRKPVRVSTRTQALVWFVLIIVVLILVWELYKVVGKALDGVVPIPVRADDTSMPHVWEIAAELFRVRRPGEPWLLIVLLRESLFTFREALAGFVLGASFGFVLAIALSRWRAFERGVMPYVVASQTIPLLAIAPIVVIWGAKIGWPVWVSVSVLAAYLVFFPVTINTLRGIKSPDPTAVELMRSYAAPRRALLWKVQLPSALPFIFAALKISATASVVGALVGELPSSLNQGLGRAILSFTYTFISGPEKLFAAILVAALLSMLFVAAITVIEYFVLRNRRPA